MRLTMLIAALALGCAAAASLGTALAAVPAGIGPAPALLQLVQSCPPGSRYIPEGYDRKGKYRPPRCSTKN